MEIMIFEECGRIFRIGINIPIIIFTMILVHLGIHALVGVGIAFNVMPIRDLLIPMPVLREDAIV